MRKIVVIIMFWFPMVAAFIDPFYGVLLYRVASIIRPEHLMWGDSSAAGRVFLAMQGVTLLAWFQKKDSLTPEYTPLPFQLKLIWLVAVEMTIVTFGYAINQDVSWRWTTTFWKSSLFYFLMVKTINTTKKLELFYALSMIWSTLMAIWGIQQKLAGNTRLEGLGGTVIPDSNGIAALFVMYVPMAYYTIYSRKKMIKLWIGIPAFVLFVIFILFTNSRGGFLGLGVVMLWIFLRTKGTQKFKMVFTLSIVGGLVILVLGQVAPEGFFDEYTARLATILGQENDETGEVEREGSASGRQAMWKGAWHVYKNHPEYWLFGVGMNGYRTMYYRYHIEEIAEVLDEFELSLVLHGGHGGKDMHNSYLSILLGGGAVTFSTWLFVIIFSLLQAHSIPKKYPRIIDGVDIHNYAKAIECGIMGWSACMILGSREFIDYFYWYLTMSGIIANLGKAKLKREELEKEDDEF